MRRNEKIACYVTVRGEKAEEIWVKGLAVMEHELREKNFAHKGGLGIGITEHIDLGIKYDPLHGHLRHGLLRAPLPPQAPGAVPDVAAGQGRVRPPVEEGGRHEVLPDQVRWHHPELSARLMRWRGGWRAAVLG